MEPEKIECEYGRHYKIGPITICSRTPQRCPYEQSVKLYASDSDPLFRCLCDGRVEKKIKKEISEEALAVQ